MVDPVSCRLCLYNTKDYYNLFCEKLQQNEVQQKIIKYLYLEIKEDDPYPKNICSKCIDRLEEFHVYCSGVEANQEVLQFSQPLEPETPITVLTSDKSDLIQLTQYSIKTENYIVTLSQANNESSTTAIDLNDFVPVSSPTAPIIDLGLPITQEDVDNENVDGTGEQQELVSGGETVNSNDSSDKLPATMNYEQIVARIDIAVDDEKPPVTLMTTTTLKPTTKRKTPQKKCKTVRTRKSKINDPSELSKSNAKKTNAFQIDVDGDSDGSEYLNNDEDVAIDLNDDNTDGDDTKNANIADGDEYIHQNLYDDDEAFAGFPKVIIKDAKLHVRGKWLLDLMSRFYRLECDLCPETSHKCKEQYERLSLLCTHYNQVHSMKGYVVCCGIKLIKPRAMALHMARHLQPDAFTCTICDKMMTCPKILQYHMQNHLPEDQRPLACPDCPRKFSYSSALIAHAISHQPESERAAHICDECGKSFSSPGRLSTHINVTHINHSQDYICHICAKQFSCRSNLTYHLTTHQPRIHQVQCEECGKWLKNKLCLRKHMVQHSKVRYACDLCDYSALNRQCLRNHIRVQHSDVKPFSCQYCGKTFKLRNTLLNHMVQHTGIRKFVCEFCGRTFASSGNYYSHRKRMHPHELAAVKKKKEEDESLLRAELEQKKFKVEKAENK